MKEELPPRRPITPDEIPGFKFEKPNRYNPIFKETPLQSLKIAVLSNIHYMAPELVANYAELYEPFINDRLHKGLLDYSEPIFKQVLSELKNVDRPDIVLIPGDLTKDGEQVSHKFVIDALHELQKGPHKMKIFVIPGSSDINSVFAGKYDRKYTPQFKEGKFTSFCIENTFTPVEKIKEVDTFFAPGYYWDFTLANAAEKDSFSHSYLAKPYPNVWVLGINAVDFKSSLPGRKARIRKETMKWIRERLEEAREQNAVVLGLMHHSVAEHFPGQATKAYTMIDSEDEYGHLIGWQATAEALSEAGLQLVFTGSFHTNDIVALNHNENTLYDIETGSLVTPPSQYRLVNLDLLEDGCRLDITTRRVTSVNCSPMPEKDTFFEYFSKKRMVECVERALHLNPKLAPELNPNLAADTISHYRQAFMAHVAGDESIPLHEKVELDNMISKNKLTPQIYAEIMSLWTEEVPGDNNVQIYVELKKQEPAYEAVP